MSVHRNAYKRGGSDRVWHGRLVWRREGKGTWKSQTKSTWIPQHNCSGRLALKPGTHLKHYLQHSSPPSLPTYTPPYLSHTYYNHHHHQPLESNASSCQIISGLHLHPSLAAHPTCISSMFDTWPFPFRNNANNQSVFFRFNFLSTWSIELASLRYNCTKTRTSILLILGILCL